MATTATSVTAKSTAPAISTEAAQKVGRDRHYIYTPASIGAWAADIITAFVGSWLFVGIHAVWFILWIVLRVEAFPYGLLTLLVSLEAIFLSTFVMMSQNRASERDHIRDDHDAEEVDLLYQINRQQLEILTLLRANLCPEDAEKIAKQLNATALTTTRTTQVGKPSGAGAANGNASGKSAAQAAKATAAPTHRKR